MKLKTRLILALIVLTLCLVYQVVESTSGSYLPDSEDVTVTFTPIVAPTVTNGVGASGVVYNGATLNGEVTDTGNENPTVTVYYGESDGETTLGSWDYSSVLGVKSLGTFSTEVELDQNTQYFYRMYTKNSEGFDWADTTEEFTTPGYLGPPTNFTATDLGGNTIRLSWEPGEGSYYTEIWVLREATPGEPGSGERVYHGTGNTTDIAGYDLENIRWVFRAWSVESDNTTYSSDGTTASVGGSSMIYFALIVLGGFFTYLSYKVKNILVCLSAALIWLGLGIWLYLSPTSIFSVSETYSQVLALAFMVLTFIPIVFFISGLGRKEITYQKDGKSWVKWGKEPVEEVESRSSRVKRKRREKLRDIRARYRR